jgi:hypothetical protein
MRHRNGAGLAVDGGQQEARRGDLLGGEITAKATHPRPQPQVIRAELLGSSRATAAGFSVTGHAFVLKLCRALIGAGQDPRMPLEAYRGATLCLRVRSIGEGAALAVEDDRLGTPRFRRWRARGDGAAPLVAQTRKAPSALTPAPKSRTAGPIPRTISRRAL